MHNYKITLTQEPKSPSQIRALAAEVKRLFVLNKNVEVRVHAHPDPGLIFSLVYYMSLYGLKLEALLPFINHLHLIRADGSIASFKI